MKIKTIPIKGIRGTAALREAAATEYRAVVDLVRTALQAKLGQNQPNYYADIEAIFPDRVIVCRDSRHYGYPYTIDANNQVSFGDPVEVVEDFRPVGDAAMKESQGIFLEAADTTGTKWRIRVIRAGLSGNNNYYPDAVLREATPLFNGARVFEKPDIEHLQGKGKAFRNLIGRIAAPVFIEGKSADTGEIQATLELLQSAGDTPAKIREAWDRKMAADLFGFSIDARGRAKKIDGRQVAQKITKVDSVDLIIEPGAGGQLIQLIEAKNPEEDSDMKLRERMLKFIEAKRPEVYKTLDAAGIDDEALEKHYQEAVAWKAPTDTDDKTVSREELDETVRMVEARSTMRVKIAESKLPDIAKAKLRKQYDGMDSFTEAQVDESIKGEREYLATLTESGKVKGLGSDLRIEGEDRPKKIANMLDAFFDESHKEHRSVQSFKECYIEITGDTRVTGRMENVNRSRFSEAIGDTFRESLDGAQLSNVLGAALRRSLIQEYNSASNYDVWRLIADIVPLQDFRTNERTRLGGYGDLPTVAEGAGYAALASPTDEKSTYAPAKRGGTEDITLEQIKNDDVGVIRRIPTKLARSAKRTLSKFVLDFPRTNPVIYDGLALYHATHVNLFTVALSLAEFGVHRLAMLKQTELSSADRIGVAPAFLLVPFDLEETATNLFTQGTENELKYLSRIRPTVVGVWYWSDVTDWVTVADKNDVPFIELGFLDGQQEPDLFVQDNPTVGSMFSNDKLTWKIRHIYGGNVLDFRGTTKAVVAG